MGLKKVISWRGVKRKYQEAKERYKDTLCPAGVVDKDAAWCDIWSRVLDEMYEEDKITESERDSLQREDFSKAPVNKEVKERIQYFLTTMFMDMPKGPGWDKLPSLSMSQA